MSYVEGNPEKYQPREKSRHPPLPRESGINRVDSGMVNETDRPNKPCQVSKAFTGNATVDRNDTFQTKCFRDLAEDEHIPPRLRGIMGAMLDDTKRKVMRIQANTELPQKGLKSLKNKYNAQYKRLKLSRNVITMNDVEYETEENSFNAVTIETVHQYPNNNSSTTVLLVGGPGEGKTTSALQYADRAMERQISGLAQVNVVVFIQGEDINWGDCYRPFDLIFKNQFANIFINDQMTECFERWVAHNPSRVSVIIDGVDEITNCHTLATAKMSLDQRASPAAILLNILRCDMYRGMWVACTVSENWLWKFPAFDINIPSVRIVGFKEKDVVDILAQLTGRKESVDQLMHRSRTIRNMCKTPAILLHLARQIQERDVYTDVEILLHALDFFDARHGVSKRIEEKKMKRVMELAYNSADQNRIELRARDLDQITAQGMGHFISVSMHPQGGGLAGSRRPKSHHLIYQFNSEAMRDILAALHWTSIPCAVDINSGLQRALTQTNIPSFMLLGVAILANKDHWPLVNSFSKASDNTLENNRRSLQSFVEYVNNNRSTLSDASTIRILSHCTRIFSGPALSKVREIRMQTDCDVAGVLSIAKFIPSLKKFTAERSVTIFASLLQLLSTPINIKISTLKIKGGMQNRAQSLSRLLAPSTLSGRPASKKLKITCIEFLDYNMKYFVEENRLEIHHLEPPMIDITKDLFHFTSEGGRVKIAKIYIDTLVKQSTRTYLEMLTSMPRDGNIFLLQIDELMCPEQVIVPTEIIDLIVNSECFQVEFLKYGDVAVLPRQCSHGNTKSSLVIDDELKASDALISLVKTGTWDKVRTREFNIRLDFDSVPVSAVNRRDTQIVEKRIKYIYVELDHKRARRRVSHDQIAPFMIKLGCTKLEFGNMTLTARYSHKEVTHISLAQTIDGVMSGEQYLTIAKSLFEKSNAGCVQIETITFQRRIMDHNMVTDAWKLKVRYLDDDGLATLDYLQKYLKLPPMPISRCYLLKLSNLSVLLKLAPGIQQIDILDLVAEHADEVKYLEQFVGRLKCLQTSLTIGSAKIIIHENEIHDITIRDITVNEFGSIYKAISRLLRQKSLLRVETLRAPSGSQDRCNELFKIFANRATNTMAIKLQVRVFAVEESIVKYLQVLLDNESRYLVVDEMKSDDGTKVTFTYNHNITIREIEINQLFIECLFHIDVALRGFGNARRNLKFWIKNCTIQQNDFRELKAVSKKLKKFLSDSPTICNISALHIQKFIPEVYKDFSDLIHAGQIKTLEVKEEYTFRTDRHCNGSRVQMYGKIDRMTVKTLAIFMNSLGAYAPRRMSLEQCEVGTRWSEISNRITGPDDEVKRLILEAVHKTMRTKTKEQLDALKAVMQSNKNLTIEKLTINARAGDVEADIISGHSVSSYLGQIQTIKIESVSLGSQSMLFKILNSGVRLEANHLFVNKPKERFKDWTETLNLMKNQHFQASAIETKCSMQEVIQTICDLYPIVNPEKICSKDYKWNIIDHPQRQKEKLLVAVRGNVRSQSIRKFTDSFKMEVVNKMVVQYNNVAGRKVVEEVSYDDVLSSKYASAEMQRKNTRLRRRPPLTRSRPAPELPPRLNHEYTAHGRPHGGIASTGTENLYCGIEDTDINNVT